MLMPFVTMAQKKIRISVPDGTSIDSTVLIGGYGIDAVESPANTWNVVADTSQLVTQYDITQKQDKLVSGTNIKTVNGNTLLGSGNVSVGTVTSVGATGGTGISVSPSTITTSGTFTITNTQPHQATNLSLSQSGSVVTLGSSTGTGVTLTAGTNVGFSTSGTNTTINVTGGGGGGTVTSVAIANGGGISVSGSPITTNGTITLTAADPSDDNELQDLSYNAGTRQLTITPAGNSVTIPLTGTAAPGLAPTRPLTNQTSVFLRGDNTWTTPAAGGGVTNLAYGTPTTSATYGYYVPLDPSTGGSPGVGVNLYADDGMEVKKGSSNFAAYKLNQSWGYLSNNSSGAGIAITTTVTKINFLTAESNGPITVNAIDDNIIVTNAGRYEFDINFHTSGAANRNFLVDLYVNGVSTNRKISQTKRADEDQSVNLTGQITLSAGQVVDVRINYSTVTGSGTDINYYYPRFSIKRLN